MKTFLNGRLEVLVGDITRIEVEAVVNAANSSLLGGGGVDGAIHRAGGPRILEECRRIRAERYPDGLSAGKAVSTTGGNLPAKWVIHTVGPIWHGGGSGEEETLRRAYTNCLKVGDEIGAASIAFPAVSTGIYGFPKDRAAAIVAGVMKDYAAGKGGIHKILLVFFQQADADLFIEKASPLLEAV
jgi:O-acetyl-ADP-ribose deacetylase